MVPGESLSLSIKIDSVKEKYSAYKLTLLYGCPILAVAVILSMFCAPGTIQKSDRAHALIWK